MMTKPTTEIDKTSLRLVRRVRDAAKRSVAAYLEVARAGGVRQRKRALEAAAIKRAMVCDALGDLIGERRVDVISRSRDGKGPASIAEADKLLFVASDRLYRKCANRSVRNLARELRTSIFGLGTEHLRLS